MPAYTTAQAVLNLPAILIANGIGAALMLLLLAGHRKQKNILSPGGRIFNSMCRLCLALCVTEALTFLLDGRQFAGAMLLSRICNVLLFSFSPLFALLWIRYVYDKLFSDRPQQRRFFVIASIPAGLLIALSLVNLTSDIFFGISQDNIYYRTPRFFLVYLVTYGYLLYGAAIIIRFQREVSKYLFLPVVQFLLPICIGSVIQFFFYGVSTIWLSAAFGLTALYINLQNELASLDPLTNLYNRTYLLQHMNHLLTRSRGTDQLAGILLDINHFKSINDRFGHLEGDLILRTVGRLLLKTVGNAGIVVRYGGDEFLILLDHTNAKGLERMRGHIAAAIEKLNAENKWTYPVAVSMGTAMFDSGDIQQFMQIMDRRMYEEKQFFHRLLHQDEAERQNVGAVSGRSEEYP